MEEHSAPTIDDFVDHRCQDAREALRELDPEFVNELEILVRSEETHQPELSLAGPIKMPRRELSREWHKLLAACLDLTMQVEILRVPAHALDHRTVRQMGDDRIVATLDYHLRSFVVHARVLGKVSDLVIDTFISTRLAASIGNKGQTKLGKKYRDRVYSGITKHVNGLRNQIVHPGEGLWGQVITREHRWEGPIAIGFTPKMAIEQLVFVDFVQRAQEGGYDELNDVVDAFAQRLGLILHDLEQEVAKANEGL